jgi:hypothetical protein
MSFAALRQTVLQAHALSSERFGELVQIGSPGDDATLIDVAAKCEVVPPWMRRSGGNDNDRRQGTLDEREWLKVTVSRDPAFANAYPTRPQPTASLYRDATKDADRRPYTFRGEVVFEGDQHAVYIFERVRKVAQGRGISS